jgi:type II secretory pathway component PulF
MAININPKSSAIALKAPPVSSASTSFKAKGFLGWFGHTVKSGDVIFFFTQLSLMIDIGMSLKDALENMLDQTESAAFKAIIRLMIQDIEEGRQLSDALQRHPQIFKHVVISMVRAGETGGYLKQILDRIVAMEEKRQSLISQIKNALTYPAVLCILAFMVVVFIMVSVLPKFTAFFEGKESILPMTTRFLITVSESLRGYAWVYALSGAGLIILLKSFIDSRQGRALIDKLFVSGPLIARISNKIYTCELLRTLGNLMESQVPMLEALKVTRDATANRYFKDFIDQIKGHVQKGGRFSQPFAAFPYVLSSVKQMVATGDEAGNLPKVMLRLADHYDVEVDRNLKSLAAMIEPLALIVLGAVVGVVVSSVILPIFKMAQVIH